MGRVALVALALLARGQDPPPWWDLHVYGDAIRSLQQGHDPYQDSIAAQQAYRLRLLQTPGPVQEIPCVSPPCSYVYSPATLPVLRMSAHLPRRVLRDTYLGLVLLGAVAVPLALLFLTNPGPERVLFTLLAPGALFYPGLILDFVVLSGNVAYVLYGLMLGAAVWGWRRGRWLAFYFAVVLASCFKLPLLSLLAIPLLSAKRAWRGTLVAAFAGLGLFGLQFVVWPGLFRNYLAAVGTLFQADADFGVSPAGLLGLLLTYLHRAYTPWTAIAYLIYAPVMFATLLHLRRQYLAGTVALRDWLSVMLLGTLLLNPRIKEYDLAAMTLPMALIVWRLFAQRGPWWLRVVGPLLLLAAAQAVTDFAGMKSAYGLLLVGLFLAATFDLTAHTQASTLAARFPA